jgi:peptidyl-prolyl cis-trans isomerase SurA
MKPISQALTAMTHRRTATALVLVSAVLAAPVAVQGAPPPPSKTAPARPAPTKAADVPLIGASRIAATVNGDVITEADIDNRARLFAVSSGMPMSPEVTDRLRSQILHQLVDERLRVQEAERRKIVVPDAQIAAAIKDIETRNNLPAGALRQKLAADGVSTLTLIDQIRAQLAWTQILRQAAGDGVHVSDQEVKEQSRLAAQLTGQPEYRVGEIFIPIDNPRNAPDAQRFAETVIKELRAGAAFPIVAAQFSQTQSALEGGEIGWVQPNQLDPGVAQIIPQMPVGAISNPVPVPGGLSIVNLQAKREIGRDMATIATLRQAFFPFTVPLTDPQNPTDQQKAALVKAHSAIATVKSCADMEAYAKANNPPNHPADVGDVRVEGVNPPAFRQLLMTQPIGKPTEPLVSRDGIAVVTVCSRDEKNVSASSDKDIETRLFNDKLQILSAQLQRDLRHKANIDMRQGGA